MRLFYKFLIALLLVSIVPILAFFFILRESTGQTLKQVINENIIAAARDMVSPVDKYMLDLEHVLDVGRKIELRSSITDAQIHALMITEMSSRKFLVGMFLLDQNRAVKDSVVSESGTFSLDVNQALMAKVLETRQVELGEIVFSSGAAGSYFDVVYPIDTSPMTFLYVRASASYLIDKITAELKKKNASTGMVVLVDDYGKMLSTKNATVGSMSEPELSELRAHPRGDVSLANGMLSAVVQTGGPQWLLVYSQSKAEAYLPIERLFTNLFALTFLILCLSVLGAYKLAGSLTKNLDVFAQGIEDVGKGNLDYHMSSDSSDELSIMRQKFNEMTDHLKKLQEENANFARLSTIGKISIVLGTEFRDIFKQLEDAVFFIKEELYKVLIVDSESTMPAHMRKLEKAFLHMDKLTLNMLYYSSGEMPTFEQQDLGQLMMNILERAAIPEKITTKIELVKTSPFLGDRKEIIVAITNIIENAVDSMEGIAAGVLTIRTKELSDRQRVCVEIIDTGSGIAVDNMKKITDPFFSTKPQAAGLGLAVAQRIIENRHQGKLDISSQVGHGTTVRIEIPLS